MDRIIIDRISYVLSDILQKKIEKYRGSRLFKGKKAHEIKELSEALNNLSSIVNRSK